MKRKCDMCGKREATIFLRQMVEGREIVFHLCEECASNRSFPIKDMSDLEKKGITGEYVKSNVCPRCGTTLIDIIENDFELGCPECAMVFETEILKIAESYGGIYRGKKPSINEEDINRRIMIMELKSRMKKLVREEKYEEAAKLKKEIEKLEGENG